MASESADWAQLKKIEALGGVDLQPHRELIARVATQVGVRPGVDLAETMRMCREAIKQGSARLMVVITSAQSAYAAENREGARAMLQKALDEEPIAYYRAILSAELGRRA